MKIEFVIKEAMLGCPEPIPMAKVIPDWWREMPKEISNQVPVSETGHPTGEIPSQTIRKCVPFLDSLRTGYCIPMWQDLVVGLDENDNAMLHWRSVAESKPVAEQRAWDGFVNPATGTGMPGTEDVENPNAFILLNPWQIKTPKGYACLFMPIINANLPLQFSAAIVNTDTYHSLINFPFFVKEKWRGTIKRGTPIMQIIPFKRDEWEMEARVETEKDRRDYNMSSMDIGGVYTGGYLENHGCPVKHT